MPDSVAIEIPAIAVFSTEMEATNRRSKYDPDKDETNAEDEGSEMAEYENEEESGLRILQEKDDEAKNNSYSAKKTVAQGKGMMDIALITANANQLRYLIEYNRDSYSFPINLFLITISLLLQVGIGVLLIFKGRLDFKGQSKKHSAKIINNYIVMSVFLVTIINVFIASFTVTGGGTTMQNVPTPEAPPKP